MAETVTMPKLGFDMAEGTLVRWVVPEGQEVKKGGVLAEIETDKATVEVESSYEGTVRKHLVNEGDVVPVGDPIAIVGSPDEPLPEKPSIEKVIEKSEKASPGAFTSEELAQGKETAAPGTTGMVGEVKPKDGRTEAEVTREAQTPPGQPEAEAPEEGNLPGGLRASPVARHMAEERGVDLRQVQGSGPGGRVTKKDIEDFLQRPPAAQPAPQAAPTAAPAPQPALAGAPTPARKPAVEVPMPAYAPAEPPPPDKETPLSRLRGAVGRRMVQSKQQVPHFYVTHEYDMGPITTLRAQLNEMLGGSEKLSVNDFIVKAVALALRSFPNVNASIQGDKIVQHGAVNIGVAVAVEGGLLTVVCKDADRKPIRQISVEVKTMAERARLGKIRPDDVDGSTFSISNLGMFDVENFSAIINPPEAAILAVGSAREVPVVVDGQIQPGIRMKATISIDHRVSDGAEAARYMQLLARYIEEPMRLLL